MSRRRRRFCRRHPSYPVSDGVESWPCSACEAEEEERRAWAASDGWAAQGALLGDTVSIPTGDGSPALVFRARPLRRRR